MIVDDEPASPKLIRSLSAPLGHTVLAFDDYQAAGQRGDAQRFDVVFAGMPSAETVGLELVRRIRNSQANRDTTIVMLSSKDDIPTLRRAFAEGANFVVPKPLAADRLRRMLAAIDSPGWNDRRRAARMPLFTEVNCSSNGSQLPLRSMNISESGMLLQGPPDVELGQEVALEFKIAEVRASLSPFARVVRKEGTDRIGIEFIGLAPEDHNAIQLYVLGRLKDLTPPRDFSGVGMRRLYTP